MQKILFPMPTMNITTGINQGSHLGSNAIDCAGEDTGIDNVHAPFTGIIKKKWLNGNTVWLESSDRVEFADGTVDFATCSFTHDNNISNLTVGQVITQGQVFYQEGTAGNASGNHIHLEIGRGKFTSTGWYQNANGNWVINNSYVPFNAFWLDNVRIINSRGYPWRTTVQTSRDRVNAIYWEVLERGVDAGALAMRMNQTEAVIRSELLASPERAPLLANKAIAKAAQEAEAKRALEYQRIEAERVRVAAIEAQRLADEATAKAKAEKDAEAKAIAEAEALQARILADALAEQAKVEADVAKDLATQSWFLKLITAIFTVITNFVKGLK